MNKSTMAAAALLCSALSLTRPALSEPQGGQVRAGQATIQQTLGTTTVEQHTGRAIIDWQRFNVGSGEMVKFVQPSEMAVILNRVTGRDPSLILGKLQANGQVFLVNPNGILFGPQAQVDVGSLVATTLGISDQSFLDGTYRFVQDPGFDLASVVNQGTLRVSDEGYVILTAPLVSNEGLIVANLGKVTLAAGQELTLNLDGRNLVSFSLARGAGSDGTVVLTPAAVSTVLRQAVGADSATRLVEEDGQIKLVGGEGTLVQAGTVRASSSIDLAATGQTTLTEASQTIAPGDIRILGREVLVQGTVDASGPAAGGSVLIGGGPRGQGPLPHALTTELTATSRIHADDGGTIVVWSDRSTTMAGELTARGGLVETSSKQDLLYTGRVTAGQWLIDPANLTIVTGAPTTNQIQNTAINAALDAGTDVIIDAQTQLNNTIPPNTPNFGETPGDVTQNAGAFLRNSTGGNRTLTIRAGATDGSILLNDDLSAAAGNTLTVVLQAGSATGAVNLGATTDIDTRGGNITSTGGGAFAQANSGTLTAGTGTVSISATDINVGSLSAGALTLNATGSIHESTDDASSDLTATTLTLSSGSGIGTTGSPLEIDVTTLALASVSGSGAINLADAAGGLTVTNATTTDGDITLSADGGNLIATTVTAGGGRDVSLTTTTSGSINVNNVSGATITASSAGAINESSSDAGADLTASALNLTAASGIGTVAQIEIDASTLTASGGAGLISLGDVSGGLTVTSAVNTSGGITLAARDGDLTLTLVDAGGSGAVFVLTTTSTTSTPSILVGQVSSVNGNLNLTSAGTIDEAVDDAGADLIGFGATLTSALGIGTTFGPLELTVGAISAVTATTSGGINLADLAGGLSVTSATTTSGDISISANGGALAAATVSAGGGGSIQLSNAAGGVVVTTASTPGGGNLTLSATSGNVTLTTGTAGDVFLTTLTSGTVFVGDVTAAGGAIQVVSAGSIEETGTDAGSDLTGNDLSLSAQTGIGASAQLEIDAVTLVSADTASGSLNLNDTAGGLTVTSATTHGGALSLRATDGTLTVTSAQAIGGGSVTLANTSSGSIVVGDIQALGNSITIASLGTLTQDGPDAAADLQATNLTLNSVNGIGLLEISAVTLVGATASTDGSITLSDLDGGLAVTSATTAAGDVTLSTVGGNLDLTTVTAGGTGSIGLATSGSGNVRLGNVTAAGDDITVTSVGTIVELVSDGSADLTSGTLTLTSAGGVGEATGVGAGRLEVDVTTLTSASASGAGLINLFDTGGGLAVTAVTTSNGAITLTSSGTLAVDTATAGGSSALSLSTTGPGTLQVGNAAGGALSLSSGGGGLEELGDDPEADLTGSSLTLSAASGIGLAGQAIELDVDTLTSATVTSVGAIQLSDVGGGLVVTSTTTTDGDVTLASNGLLTAVSVTANGTARNISLTTTGDVLAGLLTASFDDISILAGGSIDEFSPDAAPDLQSATLTLGSGSGIGALELSVSTLTSASVSGVGGIQLTDIAGGLAVTSATTADGNIAISATAGPLTATLVTAGSGQSVNLSTTVSGNLTVGNVTGGSLTLSSPVLIDEAGTDPEADLTGTSLTVTAGTGINNLELAVDTLTASVTGSGTITLVDLSGGLSVTSAATTLGNISLAADGGTLEATSVTAGGLTTVSLSTTTSGDVTLGAVTANISLTVSSAGAIEEGPVDAGVDLNAPSMTLTAVTGIGNLDPLELTATSVTLSNTGSGAIAVVDSAGGLTVTSAVSAGDVSLTATGGVLTATTVQSGGALSLTGAGVVMGSLNAAGAATVTSSVGVSQSVPGVSVTAASLLLDSATASGTLRLDVDQLEAHLSGTSPLTLQNAGTLHGVDLTTANGALDLVVDSGTLTLDSATAGGAANLTVTTSTLGDVLIGQIDASGNQIQITSAGKIGQSPVDSGAELIATSAVLTASDSIDLETDLTSLTATSPADILVRDQSGGLVGSSVSSSGGNISLSALGGNLTANSVLATSGSITLTSDASVLSTTVQSGTAITVSAVGTIEEATPNISPNFQAPSVSLDAGTGIGSTSQLELIALAVSAHTDRGNIDLFESATAATTFTLAVETGPGNINLVHGGAQTLHLVSATTFDGSILVGVDAALEAVEVTAGGAHGVTLSSPSASVLVGAVTAAGDLISITAGGSIAESTGDPEADLTAASVTLNAATGVDLDTEVDRVEALSAAGDILLHDLSALTVGGVGGLTGVKATLGSASLSAEGAIALEELLEAAQTAGLATSSGAVTGAVKADSLGLGGAGDFTLTTDVTSVNGSTTGTVTLSEASSLAVGSLSGSTVTLTVQGTISQTGPIAADVLTLSTTDADATLDGVNLVTTLFASLGTGALTFHDGDALELGAISAGSVTLDTGGPLTQSGGLLTPTLSLTGSGSNVTLNYAGNDIDSLSANLGAGALSLTDADDLTLDTLSADAVSLNVGGLLGQGGAIVVGGLTLTTPGLDVSLDNPANDVNSLSANLGAGLLSFTDGDDLDLGGVVAGAVTLTVGGALTQTGAFLTGSLSLTGAGDVTLTLAGNDVDILTASLGPGDLALTDLDELSLDGVVADALTLVTGGTLTQSGALNVNALDLTTGGHNVSLTAAGNQVGSLSAHLGTGALVFTDGVDLSLGAVQAGDVSLTTAGTLGQTGALVASTLTLTGTGDATLTRAGNDIDSLSADLGTFDLAFTDADDLALTTIVAGGLTLSTGGALSQTGALVVDTFSLTTTDDDAILTLAANDANSLVANLGTGSLFFTDADSLQLGDLAVGRAVVSANALDLNGILVVTGALDLQGAITQTGGMVAAASLSLSGASASLAGLNDVDTLSSALTGALTFRDSDDIAVGLVSGASASLVATGLTLTNDLSLTTSLALDAGTGSVTQTGGRIATQSLSVTSGGASVLTEPTNDVDSLQVNGSLSFVDTDDLSLSSAFGAALTFSTGGPLTQTGAILAGAVSLTTSDDDVTLDHVGNRAQSLSADLGTGRLSYSDNDDLAVGAVTAAGVTLITGGPLTQTGPLVADTLTVTTSDDPVTLTHPANDINHLSGNVGPSILSFSDSDDLVLDNLTVGFLLLAAGGPLTQSQAVTAFTLAVTTSGANVTLSDPANDVGTLSGDLGSGHLSFADADDLNLDDLQAATVNLTAGGAITQTGALSTTTLVVTTSDDPVTLTHVGNDIDVLVASVGVADVAFTDADGLTLGSLAADDLSIDAGGLVDQSVALTLDVLTVNGTGANATLVDPANDVNRLGGDLGSGSLSFADSDDLGLQAIRAGAVTLIVGGSLSQSAALVADTMSATVSGGLLVLDHAGNDLNSLTADVAGHDLSFRDLDDLDLVGVQALNVTARSGGDLNVGLVLAGSAITLQAGNRINELGNDPEADLTATLLDLTAVRGIGLGNNLDVAAVTLSASVTGSGPLAIADLGGGLTVVSATTSDGLVRFLTKNGDLVVQGATAGGTARNLSLSTYGTGTIRVDDLVALDGTVAMNSAGSIEELNPDTTVHISSKRVSAVSATGLGTVDPLSVSTATVTRATVSGVGAISLQDTGGGLVVRNASTTDGALTFVAQGGPLTVTSAVVGGPGQSFTGTSTGDLLVGRIAASGDSIDLTSAGRVLELDSDADADLVTTKLNVTAAGLGDAGATLETDVVRLDAAISGAGRILLRETSNLQVTGAVTANGTVNIRASGLLTLTNVQAGGLGSVIAETLTVGNVLVDNVAAGGNITVTSAGKLDEAGSDATPDLAAATGSIVLTTVTGIGTTDTLELDGASLSAVVTGTGKIDLLDTSGAGTLLALDNVTTANGLIDIGANGGSLRANHVVANGAGASVRLTTNTTGSIQVDEIVASGAVTLISAQNVSEIGVDAGDDLTAGAASSLRANAGVIATSDALEVQITGGVLSVLASAQIGGLSIKLNGLVNGSGSPTGNLIHLNAPPGTSTFNSIAF